jgi:hypothetical protein
MMQQSEGFFQAQGIVAGQRGVDALTLRLFSPDVEEPSPLASLKHSK